MSDVGQSESTRPLLVSRALPSKMPPAITADPSRARTELGWKPRTGLDALLREMVNRRAPMPSEFSAALPRCDTHQL